MGAFDDQFELTIPQPVARGKGLWTMEGLLKMGRLSTFPVRMTVIRNGKNLLLVSSFPPVPQVLEELHKLGKVKLILAPNAMHCLWGAAMRDACPGALLAGPPNAAKRFPGANWDAQVHSPEDFASLLATTLGGKDTRAWTTAEANPWMQEILLLHKPSKSLIVTDLAFNFKQGGETPLPGGPLGVILRSTYLRLAGGYRPCCCTKPVGFLLGNADIMSALLADIMQQDFDQVIVAHGDVVATDGKEAFKNGTVAFMLDVQRRRAAPHHSRIALAAGVAAVAAAGIGVWRLSWR